MAHLELPADDVRTAGDVRARALAAHTRRQTIFLAPEPRPRRQLLPPAEPRPPMPVEPPASPRPWRAVCREISRQAGVPPTWLRKDSHHCAVLIAYRQLSMALTSKLTRLSLNQIAKLYGLGDHSTVVHAKKMMEPIIAGTGLTQADPVSLWVSEALPRIFEMLGERRRKHRDLARLVDGRFVGGGACDAESVGRFAPRP
jgi:hypothetical protein